MFADDTNLFISDSTMENRFETINEELRKLAFLEYFQSKIFFILFYKKKKMYTLYLTSIGH